MVLKLINNVDFCIQFGAAKSINISFKSNKDENVHRFALSAIRGEILEREREREGEKREQQII